MDVDIKVKPATTQDSPMRKLIEDIAKALREHDRQIHSERIKRGIRARKERLLNEGK